MSLFQKAVKKESKLRMAITGPSGSGKTYTSLKVGSFIAERAESRLAVLDTESGSAAKYADLFDFDVATMHKPYSMEKYIKTLHEAAQAGYKVLIIDSLSHAWEGSGGALEMVEAVARRSPSGNSFTAWGEVTPVHRKMIEEIISSEMHIIATMRSKVEYVMQEKSRKNGGTYTVPVKVGTKPIQREGTDYEFDIVLDMNKYHTGVVEKSRCYLVADQSFDNPGDEFSTIVWDWLQGSPEAKEQERIEAEKAAERKRIAAETAEAERQENEQAYAKKEAQREKTVEGMLDAKSADVWATYAFNLPESSEWFDDIPSMTRFRTHLTKDVKDAFDSDNNAAVGIALSEYMNGLEHGATKKDAFETAKGKWRAELRQIATPANGNGVDDGLEVADFFDRHAAEDADDIPFDLDDEDDEQYTPQSFDELVESGAVQKGMSRINGSG